MGDIQIDFDNFYKIFSHKIYINEELTDPVLLYYDYSKMCIMNSEDLNNEFLFGQFQGYNKIKYIYDGIINGFYPYNSDTLIYPFLEMKTFNDIHNSYRLYPILLRHLMYMNNDNKHYKTAAVIVKLNKEDNNYYIDYYINKKIISNVMDLRRDYKIRLYTKIFEAKKLIELKVNCEFNLNQILNTHALKITCSNNDGDKLNNLLKDNIKLYNYQIEDVYWMKSLKNKIDRSENIIEYDYNTYYTIDDFERPLYYKHGEITPHLLIRESNSNKNKIVYYGGNIISSVGIGKTLIMLCYLFENDNITFNQFIDDNVINYCNYFYKRGKNKGNHCKKVIKDIKEFYCKEHSTTPFIDKVVINYKNLEYFNINDFIRTDEKTPLPIFKTNANLILCPSHLCDQWIREYYTKFKVNKRVILLVTNDQFDNLTFGDILFADLLVVSYNFLINQNYGIKYHKFIKNLKGFNTNHYNTDEKKLELLNSKNFNLLSRFYFNNKILEEFHEIYRMPKRRDIETEIKLFKSYYIWNISGTPFANGLNGFVHGLSYICKNFEIPNNNYIIKWELNDHLNYGINETLIKNCTMLYRRNTKESIKNEYKGNIINEYIHKLEFTEQERNIYDSYLKGNAEKHHNFLIQLCCDPEINTETQHLIKNCKTLDEIQMVLLEHNKQKMDNFMKNIKIIEEKIDFFTNELELIDKKDKYIYKQRNDSEAGTEIDSEIDLIESYKNKIAGQKRQLTLEKKNYDNIKKVYDYLKSVIDTIHLSETCPICLDDINIDNTAITKCGHKFCWNCIEEYIEISNITKCPKCNIQINKEDIYLLKNESSQVIVDCEDDLNSLIQNTKSTKIGNVIHYIKNNINDTDKYIIFSQWEHLLTKISDYFTKNKNKNNNVVYCKGTVYQRKKAISSFNLPNNNQSSSNIILLSSKNSASGINLTIANKIILLEPVYGTKEYREDIENQAIARANRIGQTRPIDVHRFIIKDTIEEDILNES